MFENLQWFNLNKMFIIKETSFRKLKQINRRVFFPFLKFMFDKPKNWINSQETIKRFEKNHLISFDYYKDNTQYIHLDTYNRFHGVLPKYDFIDRPINLKPYSLESKKIIDTLPVIKKYNIHNSKSLYKVVQRLRKENPILREYLNLYMCIYEYSTDELSLLTNDKIFLLIKNKLKYDWVQNLDFFLLKTFSRKNLFELNKLIAITIYLYFQDSRVLNQKIIAFNLRIQNIKISNDFLNDFKKVHMDILGYGILRQKLRTKLTLIALTSFLNTKNFLIKNKIKWLLLIS